MYLKFIVEGEFEQIEDERFTLDLNPKEGIDNMKVHITLKYSTLETDAFNLYFNGTFLNP